MKTTLQAAPVNPNSFDSLTRSQQRTIEKRQNKLRLVDELKAAGRTEPAAAKIARTSPTSLWRWRKNIVPQTPRCGRKSILESFNVTDALIGRVQKLQVSGKSAADAWRAVANDPSICPPDLAVYLKHVEKIPSCFLAASRLQRSTAKIISGKNFTHIQPLSIKT